MGWAIRQRLGTGSPKSNPDAGLRNLAIFSRQRTNGSRWTANELAMVSGRVNMFGKLYAQFRFLSEFGVNCKSFCVGDCNELTKIGGLEIFVFERRGT